MSNSLGTIFAAHGDWDSTDEEAIRRGHIGGKGLLGEVCKEILKVVDAEKEGVWYGYSVARDKILGDIRL